jgi:hypothetical protein
MWGMGPPPWVPTYHGLHAHQYSVVSPFINLPSNYCFRRIDDKCETGIGTISGILYNFSKPTVSAVSYPIRAGNLSNSRVPIPDWVTCGAGRFKPINTILQAVRSPRGPHQFEWSKNFALQAQHFAPMIKTCQ